MGETTTVAVLGTGTMGAPMARNLAAAGHDVRGWDRSRDKAEALAGGVMAALDMDIDRLKRHYDFNEADPDRHYCPNTPEARATWLRPSVTPEGDRHLRLGPRRRGARGVATLGHPGGRPPPDW